jgi:urate oxidase
VAPDADWDASFAEARRALIEAFATTHSLSLQQTLYAMGEAVLAARSELAEVRLSLPNRHHFVVDLAPFGLENPNEVFHAGDRPYGLIEGAVERDGAPSPGPVWDPYPLL